MMTMTELFYGPIEATWIVHPRMPAATERPNANCYDRNPYAVFSDDAFNYRRNPYVQRSAVPYTMVAQSEGAPCIPPVTTQGTVFPYPTRYCVHGANAAIAPVSTSINQVAQVQSPAKPVHQQSPARPGVLQPRNVTVNVQTVHFMVPLCCGKCEDKVKEQLLDLDDVQRVTCDQWKQKVTVTSSVAPEKLLKRMQKIKKRSTLWPQQQAGAVQEGLTMSNSTDPAEQFQQQQQSQKPNQVVNDENVPHQLCLTPSKLVSTL